MKTAIYIREGRMQFVLTPETDMDKQVLKGIENLKYIKVFRGSFYDCRAGWTRQGYGFGMEEDDNSLIFVRDSDERATTS